MSLSHTEKKTLLALVAQHVESRRPVKTMIIQAARNAKSGADRGRVLADLHSLEHYGLVEEHDGAWAPNGAGIKAAAAIKSGTEPKRPTYEAPKPEPVTATVEDRSDDADPGECVGGFAADPEPAPAESEPQPCRWRALDTLLSPPDLSRYHNADLQAELRELLMGLGMRSMDAACAMDADDPRRMDLRDLSQTCRELSDTLKTALIAPGQMPEAANS